MNPIQDNVFPKGKSVFKFLLGVLAAVVAGVILWFMLPNEQREADRRGDAFFACLADPTSDAEKFGHGGNCCAHLKPLDAQKLGGKTLRCIGL